MPRGALCGFEAVRWDMDPGTRVHADTHGETRASLCKLSMFGHMADSEIWDPNYLCLDTWLTLRSGIRPDCSSVVTVRLRDTYAPELTLRHMPGGALIIQQSFKSIVNKMQQEMEPNNLITA